MSIKPIDAQVIYNSTPDVAKRHSFETSKDENIQSQQALAMQKKIEQDQEQVKENTKAQEAKIKKKPERDNSKNDQQKKKKKDNEENTSTIDIRI